MMITLIKICFVLAIASADIDIESLCSCTNGDAVCNIATENYNWVQDRISKGDNSVACEKNLCQSFTAFNADNTITGLTYNGIKDDSVYPPPTFESNTMDHATEYAFAATVLNRDQESTGLGNKQIIQAILDLMSLKMFYKSALELEFSVEQVYTALSANGQYLIIEEIMDYLNTIGVCKKDNIAEGCTRYKISGYTRLPIGGNSGLAAAVKTDSIIAIAGLEGRLYQHHTSTCSEAIHRGGPSPNVAMILAGYDVSSVNMDDWHWVAYTRRNRAAYASNRIRVAMKPTRYNFAGLSHLAYTMTVETIATITTTTSIPTDSFTCSEDVLIQNYGDTVASQLGIPRDTVIVEKDTSSGRRAVDILRLLIRIMAIESRCNFIRDDLVDKAAAIVETMKRNSPTVYLNSFVAPINQPSIVTPTLPSPSPMVPVDPVDPPSPMVECPANAIVTISTTDIASNGVITASMAAASICKIIIAPSCTFAPSFVFDAPTFPNLKVLEFTSVIFNTNRNLLWSQFRLSNSNIEEIYIGDYCGYYESIDWELRDMSELRIFKAGKSSFFSAKSAFFLNLPKLDTLIFGGDDSFFGDISCGYNTLRMENLPKLKHLGFEGNRVLRLIRSVYIFNVPYVKVTEASSRYSGVFHDVLNLQTSEYETPYALINLIRANCRNGQGGCYYDRCISGSCPTLVPTMNPPNTPGPSPPPTPAPTFGPNPPAPTIAVTPTENPKDPRVNIYTAFAFNYFYIAMMSVYENGFKTTLSTILNVDESRITVVLSETPPGARLRRLDAEILFNATLNVLLERSGTIADMIRTNVTDIAAFFKMEAQDNRLVLKELRSVVIDSVIQVPTKKPFYTRAPIEPPSSPLFDYGVALYFGRYAVVDEMSDLACDSFGDAIAYVMNIDRSRFINCEYALLYHWGEGHFHHLNITMQLEASQKDSSVLNPLILEACVEAHESFPDVFRASITTSVSIDGTIFDAPSVTVIPQLTQSNITRVQCPLEDTVFVKNVFGVVSDNDILVAARRPSESICDLTFESETYFDENYVFYARGFPNMKRLAFVNKNCHPYVNPVWQQVVLSGANNLEELIFDESFNRNNYEVNSIVIENLPNLRIIEVYEYAFNLMKSLTIKSLPSLLAFHVYGEKAFYGLQMDSTSLTMENLPELVEVFFEGDSQFHSVRSVTLNNVPKAIVSTRSASYSTFNQIVTLTVIGDVSESLKNYIVSKCSSNTCLV